MPSISQLAVFDTMVEDLPDEVFTGALGDRPLKGVAIKWQKSMVRNLWMWSRQVTIYCQ